MCTIRLYVKYLLYVAWHINFNIRNDTLSFIFYNCEVDTQTFEMVDLDCNMFLYLTCLIGILS